MQYSSEQLKEITAIIEKDGKLKDVAKFLNLAVNTIRKDSRSKNGYFKMQSFHSKWQELLYTVW